MQKMNKFYNPFYHNNYMNYPQIPPPLCTTSHTNLPPQKNIYETNSAIKSSADNNSFKNGRTIKNIYEENLEKSSEGNSKIHLEKHSEKYSEENLEKRSKKHLTEPPLFEFHGIQLYSDDLLILLLIFFLYKENINDILLFVALFSLLF